MSEGTKGVVTGSILGGEDIWKGDPRWPKAPISRSERARPAGAEKMMARSARFFSYIKYLKKILDML